MEPTAGPSPTATPAPPDCGCSRWGRGETGAGRRHSAPPCPCDRAGTAKCRRPGPGSGAVRVLCEPCSVRPPREST
ncbi:hypothetical protein DI270_000765 [Microbispora triticiradicis]|uniref:Uncharacterized protein n=1 Tax=Microbispora triticiradicis TaxID=2200763 RepID=A0ABX9LS41_9ACTN|nr:hypothetical protein DI270_000765 [Microbispora triticiradicis]